MAEQTDRFADMTPMEELRAERDAAESERDEARNACAAHRAALETAMGHICRACLAPLSMGCPRYPEQTNCGGGAGPIVALLSAPDPAQAVVEIIRAARVWAEISLNWNLHRPDRAEKLDEADRAICAAVVAFDKPVRP